MKNINGVAMPNLLDRIARFLTGGLENKDTASLFQELINNGGCLMCPETLADGGPSGQCE
jgi:hypothetical protein